VPQYRVAFYEALDADSPAEAAQVFSELLAANGVRRIVVRVIDLDGTESYFDGYGQSVDVAPADDTPVTGQL
jgi:hypothetical protein